MNSKYVIRSAYKRRLLESIRFCATKNESTGSFTNMTTFRQRLDQGPSFSDFASTDFDAEAFYGQKLKRTDDEPR